MLGLAESAGELTAQGRLLEPLARACAGRELSLPRLSERPEDLRALVLAALSRFGVASKGAPLGIEPAALAALAEHDFPGNEQELLGLLARAAASTESVRVTLEGLGRSGLEPYGTAAPHDPLAPDDSPPPSLATRRRALRRAPGR